MLKFCVKFFYVMRKALSGELSCPCDRSCCLPSPWGQLLQDGWMDDLQFNDLFNSISVIQDYERLIRKGLVQWNPVYGCENFASSGRRTRDR